MTVRMLTTNLLSLLDDMVLTAAPEPGTAGYAGVLLHVADVEEGTEPGKLRCLVGTSTTGVTMGHSWVEASGYLPATLVPIQYVNTLRAGLSKLLPKKNKENHLTELGRDGGELIVKEEKEEPDLFEGEWRTEFKYGDLEDWPRNVFPLLASAHLATPPDWKPPKNRTDIESKRLAPFLRIAGRHGGAIKVYRPHQRANVHIQIGYRYRGLLVPSVGWDESSANDGAAPDIGVYAADLPARGEVASENRFATV